MNTLITGAAGYIGGMLAHQYSQREDIGTVVCLDKDPQPQWLQETDNIVWLQSNLALDPWQEQLEQLDLEIDTVVHCAWQIRDWYGGRKEVRMWNLEGSRSVFDYVFNQDSVQRLVYFSSIAQFGARSQNTTEERFTETSKTTLTGYCYADDKHEVDMLLHDMYKASKKPMPVMVLKSSTITGPRGRVGVGKFSLAAALSSDADKSQIPWLVQKMLSFMPIVGRWTRQFVHEDDITDVVTHGVFSPMSNGINTYIVSPQDIITGKEMADMMNKVGIPVPALAARIVFACTWHLTRGRVPTAPGVWKFFAYPICVDGTKTVHELGHKYKYTSHEAISQLQGRYTTQDEARRGETAKMI
jgi:nucleoside-diphosphate-sugar epimerase